MKTSALLCFAVPEEANALPRNIQRNAVFTGIGRKNARRTLERYLTQKRPRLILSCGFAGGLNPKLPRGTVVWNADNNFPFINELRDCPSYEGTFHCVPKVLVTEKSKLRLWRDTGCDCVEMESGEIRRIARAEGIPAATIRVISDASSEDLPLDFNRLWTTDMRLSYFRLTSALLRQPKTIKPLLQFRKCLQSAAENLAAVILPLLQSEP